MIGWWTVFCKVKHWTSYKSDIINAPPTATWTGRCLIKGVKGWFLCVWFTISTTVVFFFYHSCCTEEPHQRNNYNRFFWPLILRRHKSESKSNNYYIHSIWIILISAATATLWTHCWPVILLLILKINNRWSEINLKHTWYKSKENLLSLFCVSRGENVAEVIVARCPV